MNRPPHDAPLEKWLEWHEFHTRISARGWKKGRKAIAAPYVNDDLAYATAGIWFAAKIIRVLNLLPENVKRMRMLDYGCGTGKVTRALSYFFGSTVGFDPVEECISVARKETARCADLTGLGQLAFTSSMDFAGAKKSFDVVVSTDVLPTIPMDDCRTACGRIGTILKDGGLLVANHANYQSDFIAAELGLAKNWSEAAGASPEAIVLHIYGGRK